MSNTTFWGNTKNTTEKVWIFEVDLKWQNSKNDTELKFWREEEKEEA